MLKWAISSFKPVVILISIYLIMSNLEHLFMCLSAICMSSLEKCLFSSLAHFLFNFYFYFILLYNTVLVLPYIDLNPPQVYMLSQTWTPLGCLFFLNWAAGVAYIFLKLIICQLLHLLLSSPILKGVFSPCL